MANFNKEGYSTTEVGQILGCCQNTVWNMVNQGKIKALIEQKDKRKVIRITRAALIEYLKGHRARYSKELLNAFGIGESFNTKAEEPAKGSFIPGTTTKPVGMWKDLLERENGEKTVSLREPVTISGTLVSDISEKGKKLFANNTTETKLEFKPAPASKEKQVTGMVAINGRIAIANVTPETAAIIFNAVKDDPVVDFDELKLVVNRR